MEAMKRIGAIRSALAAGERVHVDRELLRALEEPGFPELLAYARQATARLDWILLDPDALGRRAQFTGEVSALNFVYQYGLPGFDSPWFLRIMGCRVASSRTLDLELVTYRWALDEMHASGTPAGFLKQAYAELDGPREGLTQRLDALGYVSLNRETQMWNSYGRRDAATRSRSRNKSVASLWAERPLSSWSSASSWSSDISRAHAKSWIIAVVDAALATHGV